MVAEFLEVFSPLRYPFLLIEVTVNAPFFIPHVAVIKGPDVGPGHSLIVSDDHKRFPIFPGQVFSAWVHCQESLIFRKGYSSCGKTGDGQRGGISSFINGLYTNMIGCLRCKTDNLQQFLFTGLLGLKIVLVDSSSGPVVLGDWPSRIANIIGFGIPT